MLGMLNLHGVGDIAQIVLAAAGVAALIGAYVQIRVSRRSRVYEYADSLNSLEIIHATAEHKAKWPTWTTADIAHLSEREQLECMRLPNFIEQIGHVYNRGVLDRGLAAELLGPYVERMWSVSWRLIGELRVSEKRPRIFTDWQRMQDETWRRRGAPGPMGMAPESVAIDTEFHRLKYVFSAEYRLYAKRYDVKRTRRGS
jgi:hypothetical protein